MRQIVTFICFTVSGMLFYAAEPNYIRTTTYDVGGTSDDIVVTDYYDGTGKVVQNKQQLGMVMSELSHLSIIPPGNSGL
ncbi:MAG TPA: hypothetical protein VHO70_15125 [Chitinispirillaceae bacterium]|nr:hypothetical protein [Chitinispirillaceae bacterium]